MVTSFDRNTALLGSTTPVDKLDCMLMMVDEMREACEVCAEKSSKEPTHDSRHEMLGLWDSGRANVKRTSFSDSAVFPSTKHVFVVWSSAWTKKICRGSLVSSLCLSSG